MSQSQIIQSHNIEKNIEDSRILYSMAIAC